MKKSIALRILSLFLAAMVLVGVLPFETKAAQSQASIDSSDYEVKGTNSFGNLISSEIEEQQAALAQEESEYSGGYTVAGLSIDGNVATVEYSSLEKAILVVSLYTEDGLQMLLSQNTTVDPDGSIATLTFNDDVPEYFVASAYLLDSYDYSPLCVSYSTPMYTREMQELLASTVDDYDADRVLNLGGDNTTNFAVYEDSTIVIEAKSGVNTVANMDEENATYVIENIDENIAGLQRGDVFAYPYGENEILIVKVASITVNGTVATITGDELEIEEVFSHVKLESTGTTGDLTVDEATGDEGVSYVGKITDGAAVMSVTPYGLKPPEFEDNASEKVSLGFNLEKKTDTFTLKGSLALSAEVSFSYYISLSKQYLEFTADVNTALTISFEGKSSVWESKLPSMGFSPVPSLRIGFEPKLVFKISAKIEASLNVGYTKSFSYENGVGVKDLSTSPKIDIDFNAEGTLFFGLDLAPQLSILDGWVAKIEFSALAGIEVKAKMNGTKYDDAQIVGGTQDPESIHTCESCLSIDAYAKSEFSIKLHLLKLFNTSFKFTAIQHKIGVCYYSFTEDDFGWGSCPYKRYRVAVYVQDSKGAEISGANVSASLAKQETSTFLGTTNSNGTVVYYLPAGTYTFKVSLDGETLEKEDVEIEEACKITLNSTTTSKNTNSIPNAVDPEKITDKGVIASGECGAEGANVTWTLYSSGLLEIAGEGDMGGPDYNGNGLYPKWPWHEYSESIVNVIIKDGVTSVGAYAFCYCSNITSITIPNSVTHIGESTFLWCDNLNSITIPESVTSIGESAFIGCYGLTGIWVDEQNPTYSSDKHGVLFNKEKTVLIKAPAGLLRDYTVPSSVTKIDNSAFANCLSLGSITIPDSVTSIGESAFVNCDQVGIWVDKQNPAYSSDERGVLFNKDKTVLIEAPAFLSGSYAVPESVTSIGNGAFYECSYLTELTLPDSVSNIGDEAFYECSGLAAFTIPDSVTTIGDGAFLGCTGLTTITIPDGVTIIGEMAFIRCSMTKLVIPDSVTSIGGWAFEFCSRLTDVTISNSMTHIANGVFYGCDSLTSVKIPDSVSSIGDWAFSGCSSLTSISIPDSVTSIGDSAFRNCSGLAAFTIPASVTSIGYYAFDGCNIKKLTIAEGPKTITSAMVVCKDTLQEIVIPDSVTSIAGYAFENCSSLTSITIPDSVTSIGDVAFRFCSGLTSITIPASVTSIGNWAFESCISLTDVYFTGSEAQWTSIHIGYYNDYLTDANIHYGDELLLSELQIEAASVDVVTDSDETEAQDPTDEETEGDSQTTDQQDAPTLYSIYDGEYSTEITDEYMLKTASFAGLVPGEEYLLLALVSIEGNDVLAPDNLLYIDQDVAAEDGTLVFTYVQRVATDTSYVMACGASNNDLSDATVTFPAMTASKEVQTVKPVVTYGEEQLIEGIDYVVVGTVDYTATGEYTCYIRGIYDYTGLVKCVYTVAEAPAGVTLSGNYKSFGNAGDSLTIQLFRSGSEEAAYTFTNKDAAANSGAWSIEGVTPGSYTVKVSKHNHVAREYALTVGSDGAKLDVEVWLIGDVTGDGLVNFSDYSKVLSQSKKPNSQILTDYAFLCGDVNADGAINFSDYSKVLSQAKGNGSLW